MCINILYLYQYNIDFLYLKSSTQLMICMLHWHWKPLYSCPTLLYWRGRYLWERVWHVLHVSRLEPAYRQLNLGWMMFSFQGLYDWKFRIISNFIDTIFCYESWGCIMPYSNYYYVCNIILFQCTWCIGNHLEWGWIGDVLIKCGN